MPLTLFRYVGRELVKLLAMTAAALTVLIAVAFMVKPMSEGALDFWSLGRLVLYLMPPMLPYALLFSATLSGTLVYHRMAADHELTACAMTGMSYRMLLVPCLTLGVVLMLGLFYFSNWIVPTFWQRVEQLVKQDVARIFVDRLDTEGVVRFRSILVYADDASVVDQPSGPNLAPTLDQRIRLDRVAVAKFDDSTGDLEFDVTGRVAVADLHRHGGQTYALVKVTDAALKDTRTGALIRVNEHTFPPQRVPSLFEQKPKFLSLSRLAEVARQPELDPGVRERSDDLLVALAARRAAELLHERLLRSGDEPVELRGPEGRLHRLAAPIVQPAGRKLRLLSEPGQPLRVRIGPRLVAGQLLEAERGMAEVSLDHADAEPVVVIELENVVVSGEGLLRPTEKRELALPRLRLSIPVTADLRPLSPRALVERAEQINEPRIATLAQRLTREIDDLNHQIVVTANERAAMSVSMLLMLMLGAVLSMLLRGLEPLVIFFCSFLPAVVALFLIFGAENLIKSGALGLGVWFNTASVWSGNLLLAALIFASFLKLNRH